MGDNKTNESTNHLDNKESAVNKPTHFVGIGASAGGLEAIESFFKHMPAKSGLAFIVIQHLSPDYKSLMVELLSKKTEMSVNRAEDGIVVEADNVYLIPPKTDLTIFHGKLLLKEQEPHQGINLPIDIFFRSLAEDQAERAVGIVLSGTGSDGTRGVRAIKEFGGMVMVQDEESAKFDGMPRAAASTGLADFILPPYDMPKQLLAFAKHPYEARRKHAESLYKDEDSLTRIFAELRAKTKVDFTFYKPSTIIRRIERRMTVNQFKDIEDYVRYLRSYPGEVMTLYRELLIGVTNFFRDPAAMEELGERYLPEILTKTTNREIRFWIAGCSTGEEAYTLAILAREAMEKLGVSRDVKIFATDLDKDAIMVAGNGIYPESIAADLTNRLLGKYFYRKDESFQIARHVREMVVFAQHNLIKDPPFTNIDFVSCRNLLIYLQPVLQQKALEMFNFSLNPNGILFLGTSETVGDMAHYFEPLHQRHKIYRSKGKAHPAGHSPVTLEPKGRGERGETQRQPTHMYEGRQRFTGQSENWMISRYLEVISENYLPLSVIVNEQMEIVHTLGDPEGFFRVPSGRAIYDISKMAAKDLAIPLATGIQKVFRSREEMTYTNIRLRHMDETKSIRMRILPLPEKKGHEPLVAVFLEEIKRETRAEKEADAQSYDLTEEAEQRIQDLELDLQFTKENLQATIEELETSNEELQATNEELLASNEELQSTNEELQSTNEELHTVNAEYQNKINELTELTNDVDNLLTNSLIGILLLDEDLEIRKYSPEVCNVFRIMDKDIGRPIGHLAHRLVNFNPIEAVRSVVNTNKIYERDVQAEDGRHYLLRVVPYSIGPTIFSGVVVTFVDITELKHAEKELKKSRKKSEDIITHMPAGLFVYSLNDEGELILESSNAEAERITGVRSKEWAGKPFDAIWPQAREEGITRRFRQVLETGENYYGENVEYQDEKIRGAFRIHAFPLPEKRLAISFEDITDRKKAEEALRRSEEKYKQLAENTDAILWEYSIEKDEWVYVAPQVERILGYKPEEWTNLEFWQNNIHEADRGWATNYCKEATAEGKAHDFEYRFYKKNGKTVWVKDVVSVQMTNGEPTTLRGFMTDITERKNAEEKLKASEERFRKLFQTMAQGVVYQDAEGKIIAVNPSAERILGLSFDQMRGRTSADPRWKAMDEAGNELAGDEHPAMIALRTGDPVYSRTLSIFNPVLNQTRWIVVNAVPEFLDEEEKPYQVYATFEDITDRVESERESRAIRQRLDYAFEVAGLAWWDWEVKSGKVSVSRKKVELLGFTPGEVGSDLSFWTSRIHPEDYDKAMGAMERHLKGETEKYDVRYRLRRKDGDYVELRDVGEIVERDEAGKPARLLGTVQKVCDEIAEQ